MLQEYSVLVQNRKAIMCLYL